MAIGFCFYLCLSIQVVLAGNMQPLMMHYSMPTGNRKRWIRILVRHSSVVIQLNLEAESETGPSKLIWIGQRKPCNMRSTKILLECCREDSSICALDLTHPPKSPMDSTIKIDCVNDTFLRNAPGRLYNFRVMSLIINPEAIMETNPNNLMKTST